MKNKKKVIFVPGHGLSSPTEVTDWPNWLGQQLEKKGFDFIRLSMPNPMYPEVGAYVDFLNQQKFEVDENTYFVGHSLGCITTARFLEKLPLANVAGGCVFVAGFCSFLEIPLLQEFCTLPLDFSEVRKHSKEFTVIISDNDHVIPRVRSEELAEKLNAKIIVEHKKGHFISGIREIRSALDAILEMDKQKSKFSIWKILGF